MLGLSRFPSLARGITAKWHHKPRFFSSGIESVPFLISSSSALSSFKYWHSQQSPLPITVTSLQAFHIPFWSFSALHGERSLRGSPSLQIYAGSLVPRSIAHSHLLPNLELAHPYYTYLVAVPSSEITVEPFSLYEAPAWGLAQAAYAQSAGGPHRLTGVTSRRILAPIFCVQYTVLGLGHTAYMGGSTTKIWAAIQSTPGAQLYAYWHALFPAVTFQTGGQLGGLLGALLEVLARLDPAIVKLLYTGLGTLLRLPLRALLYPPFLLGLLSLTGHTLVAPTLAYRRLAAQWAAQHARERAEQAGMQDVWRFRERAPSGSASSTSTSSSAGRPSSSGSGKGRKPPYIAPGDYHGLLGVSSTATKAELSVAFRKQLQSFHPDHAEANGWDAKGAAERTVLILEAYKALRRGLR
jgi:hypothetical protein